MPTAMLPLLVALFLHAAAGAAGQTSNTPSCSADLLDPKAVCPCNVEPPAGIPRGVDVVSLFLNNLNASTKWEVVNTIPLQVPDAYHPQGLVVHQGNQYFMSTVNVINRSMGQGEGYLMKFDAAGKLLGQHKFANRQPAYHPGGIDSDGQDIYMPLAEYHSGSACGAVSNCQLPGTSYMYKVSAENLTVEELFSYKEHVGSANLNGCEQTPRHLYSATWGSRSIIEFALPGGKAEKVIRNPVHISDYQDCKALWGCAVALCAGVKDYAYQFNSQGSVGPQLAGGLNSTAMPTRFRIGSLGLVDLNSGITFAEVPVVAALTPQGEIVTTNTVAVALAEDGKTINFLFAPDDNEGSITIIRPIV